MKIAIREELKCKNNFCSSPPTQHIVSKGFFLPVTSTKSSLEEALSNELADETVTRSCSYCKCSLAYLTKTIDNYPDVLAVKYLRFLYNRENFQVEKISNSILSPNHIWLAGQSYRLSSAIIHKGESTLNGHYICQVISPDNSRVMTCNDENVSLNTTLQAGDAFVLFYVKSKDPQQMHCAGDNSSFLPKMSGVDRLIQSSAGVTETLNENEETSSNKTDQLGKNKVDKEDRTTNKSKYKRKLTEDHIESHHDKDGKIGRQEDQLVTSLPNQMTKDQLQAYCLNNYLQYNSKDNISVLKKKVSSRMFDNISMYLADATISSVLKSKNILPAKNMNRRIIQLKKLFLAQDDTAKEVLRLVSSLDKNLLPSCTLPEVENLPTSFEDSSTHELSLPTPEYIPIKRLSNEDLVHLSPTNIGDFSNDPSIKSNIDKQQFMGEDKKITKSHHYLDRETGCNEDSMVPSVPDQMTRVQLQAYCLKYNIQYNSKDNTSVLKRKVSSHMLDNIVTNLLHSTQVSYAADPSSLIGQVFEKSRHPARTLPESVNTQTSFEDLSTEDVSLPTPEYVPIRRNTENQCEKEQTFQCHENEEVDTPIHYLDEDHPMKEVNQKENIGEIEEDDCSSLLEISQWKNNFFLSEENEKVANENIRKLKAWRKERMNRINNEKNGLEGLGKNPIIEAGIKIHLELSNTKWTFCKTCNEKWLDVPISPRANKCPRCLKEKLKNGIPPTFSSMNDMHARDAPDVLQCLNQVEQAAVSRIAVIIKMYRLRGGSLFLKGHIIAFEQDLPEFAHRLPPCPAHLPMIVLVAPGQKVPLRANRHKILAALEWLQSNNPFYADLDIDFDALNQYPNNSNDYVEGIDVIEDPGLSSDQGEHPTVYTPTEHNADFTYSTIPQQVNRKSLREEIANTILNSSQDQRQDSQQHCESSTTPTINFPKRSSTPVSEWTEGYMSMAFPWLPGFCWGQCDITVPRIGKRPTLFQWVNHLLKHPSRAFANDPRFLLAMCNRYLRDKSFSLGNVFAKNNAKDITVKQLKERVAEGDDAVFQSLLSFSRSVPGTRQFWKYKVRQAYSLVNWVHITSDGLETFNLFLTLSFADIHIRELHALLPGNEKYIDKKVVKSMKDVPPGDNPAEYIDQSTDHRLRSEAINQNGDITSFFLNKKLELLIEEVLIKCLGVMDYLIRCEFQYRSSEHFHMVLRVKNGLSLDTIEESFKCHSFDVKKCTDDFTTEELFNVMDIEQKRAKVREFASFQAGLSSLHPEFNHKEWPEGDNSSAPPINCLRQVYEDVVRTPHLLLTDLINLVNRVLRHFCKLNYCLNSNKPSKNHYCKLGYPKEIVGYQIKYDEQNTSLVTAVSRIVDQYPEGSGFIKGCFNMIRNHSRIVTHIPEILVVWRGNTDAQIIRSLQDLLRYVLKYMFKPETGSETFQNVVNSLTANFDDESPVRRLFCRVLLKTLNEHDISRTEAYKIFSPNDFVLISRPLRSVNTLGTRQVNIGDNNDNDGPAVKDNVADVYWKRGTNPEYLDFAEKWISGEVKYPRHPDNISLYQFVSHFNRNWTISQKLYVPHPTLMFHYPPRLSAGEYRLKYCETMLLLHKPGTSPTNLSDDLENELAIFVEDPLCPLMIRKEYMKSLITNFEDEEEGEELLPSPVGRQVPNIDQDEVMIGLGGRILQQDINSQTGVEDDQLDIHEDVDYSDIQTDIRVDWEEDRKILQINNDDIKIASDWIERKRVEVVIEDNWDATYEKESLNNMQQTVFDQFQPIIESVVNEEITPEGELIDLSGYGGTGKTRLIRTMLQDAERKTGKRGVIKVAAYTNSAASHFVGGKTIHRLLRIGVANSGTEGQVKRDIDDLNPDKLKELQNEMKETVALIIDEKSMCGQWMLYAIDQRCRQAKPKSADKPFGNLTMMLAGDLTQLPPVGDRSLYALDGRPSKQQSAGRLLYLLFKKSFFLTESMRQAGDSNAEFRDQLQRLAEGQFSIDDWRIWSMRSLGRLPKEEKQKFEANSTKLCALKRDMKNFNISGLKRTQNPLLITKSRNDPRSSSIYTSDRAGNIQNTLPLTKGAKVVLTANIWPEAKLLNGSKGTVLNIIFSEGQDPAEDQPNFLICHFPDYIGPDFLPTYKKSVPIFPIRRELFDKGKLFSRTGLPLILGYAVTIHKSQGEIIVSFNIWNIKM